MSQVIKDPSSTVCCFFCFFSSALTCVHVCVIFDLGILDGRWDDYQTHHQSLPDLFSPLTYLFHFSLCQGFEKVQPTVEVTYLNQHSKDRGNEKFKIMNIKVCSFK